MQEVLNIFLSGFSPKGMSIKTLNEKSLDMFKIRGREAFDSVGVDYYGLNVLAVENNTGESVKTIVLCYTETSFFLFAVLKQRGEKGDLIQYKDYDVLAIMDLEDAVKDFCNICLKD